MTKGEGGRKGERERSQGAKARVERGKEGRAVVISFSVSRSGGNDLPEGFVRATENID